MSVYNGERFLAEAIESVLSQTFTDFEFLILDDGSQDSTRAIIERFAAQDDRIRPSFRENRGLVASLNELLAQASAPIVARMDADDICAPERFDRQVKFLAANPDVGVVGTWSQDIDEHGQLLGADKPEAPASHEEFLDAIERGKTLICHPAVMYRRDIVLAAGGYHGAFRHCEDLDLWLRLSSTTKITSIPERLIFYRHCADQVSNRHAAEQGVGAAVARLAYQERQAGRQDPTERIEKLPSIDALDNLFGRAGVAREVRASVSADLLYSHVGLRNGGMEIVARHLRDRGGREGMWRTVARLIRYGEFVLAGRLTATLAATSAHA